MLEVGRVLEVAEDREAVARYVPSGFVDLVGGLGAQGEGEGGEKDERRRPGAREAVSGKGDGEGAGTAGMGHGPHAAVAAVRLYGIAGPAVKRLADLVSGC